MRRILAACLVATGLLITPGMAPASVAQPRPSAPSGGSVAPIVVGAAAGATFAALAWPMLFPGAMMVAAAAPEVAAAAPVAVEAGWGMGSFVTLRAAIGAVIGGGLGYLSTR